MSQEFFKRLKQYENPETPKNWHGCSREQDYLDRWSERATSESKIAPRAKGDVHISLEKDQDLPSIPTDKAMANRDSSMQPFRSRKVDNAMTDAKSDLNHVGGSHLKNVRREG